MAAVKIEKIPTLTGEKAKKFIEKVENPKQATVSEQQLKIYNHFKAIKNKK